MSLLQLKMKKLFKIYNKLMDALEIVASYQNQL